MTAYETNKYVRVGHQCYQVCCLYALIYTLYTPYAGEQMQDAIQLFLIPLPWHVRCIKPNQKLYPAR